MAGQIRLFEKVDGLLVEVAPEKADDRRASGTISHMNLTIDVLWTAEEEAARNAETAAAAIKKTGRDAAEAEIATERAAILEKIGLSEDEVRILLR